MRINITYFLNFVRFLRDFRVSSPKCAFLTDTRKREEIINGIQYLIHRLALPGCSSDFKSGNSTDAALREESPLFQDGPESFVATGERSLCTLGCWNFQTSSSSYLWISTGFLLCQGVACTYRDRICRLVYFILIASNTRDTIFLLSNY